MPLWLAGVAAHLACCSLPRTLTAACTPSPRPAAVVEGDPVPLKPPTAEELAAFDRAVQKAKAERGQERAQLFAELAKDAEEHDVGIL